MSDKDKEQIPEEEIENIDQLDDALNDFDEKLNLTCDQNDIMKDIMDPKLKAEYEKMMEGIENNDDIQKAMGDILGGLNNESIPENQNFDGFANQILLQFMNKEILFEPLQEAKKAYEEYFDKNADHLHEPIFQNYISQAECIDDILTQLEKSPDQKEELISYFEKMQSYGNPPKEIMDVSKDSPFNFFDKGAQEQCSIF